MDITPAYGTISGKLTISPAVTGTLSVDTPLNVNLSSLGQSAHLSFTATGTQELSLNLGALSTQPADQLMYVSNGSLTTGLSFNLGRLAAGNYFVWLRPQSPVTSTLEVALRATSTVPVDGTPVSFATPRVGQVAYFNFTAAASDSLSVAFSEVVLSPAGNTLYYVNVYRTSDLAHIGSASCHSTWIGCEVPLRQLAQAGTYRVDIAPAYGTRTIGGKLTISPVSY